MKKDVVSAELANLHWDSFNKLDMFLKTRVIIWGWLHYVKYILRDEKVYKDYLIMWETLGNDEEGTQ